MNIQQVNYKVYTPTYKNVSEVRRSEPIQIQQTQPVQPQEFKYGWKTIATIAGIGVLALWGISNRKSISKLGKKIFRSNDINQAYFNPHMKVAVNNAKPENPDIIEGFMPELLSDIGKKNKGTNPHKRKPRVYVNEEGDILHQECFLFGDEQPNRVKYDFGSDHNVSGGKRKKKHTSRDMRGAGFANEVADRVVDFAIMDDLINGGKEVKVGFDFVKNTFRNSNKVADDIVGSTGGVGENVAEHLSIFDKISDGISDATEALSDIGESVVDTLGDMV